MTPRLPSRLAARRAFALVLAAVALLAGFAPRAARAARIEFTEYDLPNGLHVILAPEHSAPVFSSYLLYHVGSKNERPDRTGFAHFFEHLMFEGTENIGRGEIFKIVTAAGGNLNASTSFDQTDYYINLPANQYGLALWIESERMMHAKIEQIGVDTQRQVVKEERRMRYDNAPYGGLFEEVAKLVFAGSPYSWVPIGSVQYIDQATLEEFRAFYKTYYLPNNATLVLSGDFDPAKMKDEVAAYFGPIPRGPDPIRPDISVRFSDADPAAKTTSKNTAESEGVSQPAPTKVDVSKLVLNKQDVVIPETTVVQTVDKLGSPQDYILSPAVGKVINVNRQNTPLPASLHAWLAPKETAGPDAYAVEMLTNILAHGRSSRLYRRLVDQEQAAVEASAFPYFLENAGMVGVFAVGSRGITIEKLDALIEDEVNKVRLEGVTEEEFQKARNQKESETASSYGTVQARAQGLAHYHVYFGNTDLVNTELDEYLKVKREDLQRVAGKYLTKESTNILHYPVPAAASAPAPGTPRPEPSTAHPRPLR